LEPGAYLAAAILASAAAANVHVFKLDDELVTLLDFGLPVSVVATPAIPTAAGLGIMMTVTATCQCGLSGEDDRTQRR
jgi:hypothetical protein